MVISTLEDLVSFCDRAATCDAIAVDTEFLRERTYRPRLCLVQIATKTECVAIDPLAVTDLGPLADLMANRRVLKVFHACAQDMEVMYHRLGVLPKPMFDTQVAAAFLGMRMQVGYNAVVHAYCGVDLAKKESLTDWSRRPLTDEQVGYALDDVRYLIKVYYAMRDELAAKHREPWVRAELEPLARTEQYEVDRRQVYKRVKRITSCTRRQLAVARELAEWREKRAEKADIPRKWVMSDEVLLAICKRMPKTSEDFRRVRGTEQLSGRDVDAAMMAIERGMRCPADRLPPANHPHRTPSHETESVSDLMYALVRLISERSGVATAMIASREDLFGYIKHPERSRLSQGWRHELVGSQLDELLAGNIGLTVKDGTIEIL